MESRPVDRQMQVWYQRLEMLAVLPSPGKATKVMLEFSRLKGDKSPYRDTWKEMRVGKKPKHRLPPQKK